MSVAGMIAQQGTLATVYRGTSVTNDDGTGYLGAPWTVRATELPMSLQQVKQVSEGQIGGLVKITVGVGYTHPNEGLEDGDRFVVTAGPFTGRTFVLLDPEQHVQGAPGADHLKFAFRSANETPP